MSERERVRDIFEKEPVNPDCGGMSEKEAILRTLKNFSDKIPMITSIDLSLDLASSPTCFTKHFLVTVVEKIRRGGGEGRRHAFS